MASIYVFCVEPAIVIWNNLRKSSTNMPAYIPCADNIVAAVVITYPNSLFKSMHWSAQKMRGVMASNAVFLSDVSCLDRRNRTQVQYYRRWGGY